MYYNKFLKYKIKYNEKIKDEIYTSYKKIDNVLSNLDKVYFEVKDVIQRSKPKILTQKGGKMKNYDNYEKIKKYKKFIKYAKSTIIQYRNMINQYHVAALSLNSKYLTLFNILKTKKKELEKISSNVNILNLNSKHNKDKIELLETTISLLGKNINEGIDFDVQINADGQMDDVRLTHLSKQITGGKKNIQTGGDIDNIDDFTNEIDKLMQTVASDIQTNNKNVEVIQDRFRSLVDKMKEISDQKENINAIKVNLEFVINKLEQENVDFNALFLKFNEILEKNKATIKQPDELLKYHNEIQKFVSLIDRLVLSNKQIIQNMSTKNQEDLKAYKELINQVSGPVQSGGSHEYYNKQNQKGGTLINYEDYFKSIDIKKTNKITTEMTELTFFEFMKDKLEEYLNDESIIIDEKDKRYNIVISIISLYEKLDIQLKLLNPYITMINSVRTPVQSLSIHWDILLNEKKKKY
jgi:hypothetical protein